MISEDALENQALDWFRDHGYGVVFGPDIEPEGNAPEREDFTHTVLLSRLDAAIERLNPTLPYAAREEAARKILNPSHVSLERNNRELHNWLVNGVPVDIVREDGGTGEHVTLVDFENPDNNDWLVVNQFTVKGAKHLRRPDIVVFLNGLPITVLELKNPADLNTDIWKAFNQLQTYRAQIDALFHTNELLVISDGIQARVGSLTANREWFMPWRTIEGDDTAPAGLMELEVLIRGLFDKKRLLDYLRYFVVYEDEGDKLIKKIAGYHQFHAVRQAVDKTVGAVSEQGDRRCGVVWHTQGSGKSLTMAFYAAKVARHPALGNPTLVVITDRNDLDDQLYGTFAGCAGLLRQTPEQAGGRDDLRELLSNRASGGIVFTTIQKFLPENPGERFDLLSERQNIIVIADEAHRSQYGFKAKLDKKTGQYTYGFAQHLRDALPHAGFIGFTGTPVEKEDKDTRAVFGEYISIYDIQQAVEDKATVPIYYEGRLIELELDEQIKAVLDDEMEEIIEDEEEARRERLKTKWAALEALVGAPERIRKVAQDLVEHFEGRLDAIEGKAMVVCMSRRICVDLYKAIAELRPDWDVDDDEKGQMKVVMTGSASDPASFQPHVRSKAARERLAKRFKDASDEFKLVLVRDMWLTGFDAPCLHTMYLDKPMRGHGFMQAIARVNRVFRDKQGGLVVDYLGLAQELKQALATYTQSGGKGQPTHDIDEAVAVLKEKLEICHDLFDGFDYSKWQEQGLQLLPGAVEHVLQLDDGKKRYNDVVTAMTKAMSLCGTHQEAMAVREEVAFFQAVRAALVKSTTTVVPRSGEDVDHAIKQIISKAIVTGGVVDIFEAAGLDKPNIGILDDQFLEDVRQLPQKNLAVELLERLLKDEIKARGRTNVVQSRSFTELLEQSINKYHNRAIQTAQVIEELIKLAKEMNEAMRRGDELGLTDDELAFYDALEVNDSAVQVLGDETLKEIAQFLVEQVRKNATIDWKFREGARAKLRVIVKRVLKKYGYPPDKQEHATDTVLQQAETLSELWAA